MEKRIKTINIIMLILIVGSAVICAAAVPLRNDRELMKALQELRQFQAGFQQQALEKFLFETATVHESLPLQSVASFLGGPNSPIVRIARRPPLIVPWARVDLSTIGQVHAFGGKNATVQIGVIKPEEAAASIEWRLVRRKASDSYQLDSITLSREPADPSLLELERRVIAARQQAIKAKMQFEEASDKFTKVDNLYTLQRKWRSSWRVLQKTLGNRNQAQAEMDKSKLALDQAKAEYFDLAEKAEKSSTSGAHAGSTQSAGVPSHVFAIAAIQALSDSARFQFRFPVALEARSATVPGLTGCDFAINRASNFWSEVSGRSVQQAIAVVERKFSWHYRYLGVGGIKIGGMTFLQLAPLFPLATLLLLFLRMRRAIVRYNPFDARTNWASLPRMGFEPFWINLAAVLLLPTAASLLCIYSLWRIFEVPATPIICLLGSLAGGFFSYSSLKEFRRLSAAVIQSRANRLVTRD